MTIGTHQAHTVVGARVPAMGHPLRHALMLLNNILAGPGMNSLLNVELRERRGYVYTVESTLTTLSDCGWMEIYLGCDPADVRSSLRVIKRITGQLAADLLPGRGLLYRGKVATVDETIERIQAVTPEQIAQAAAYLAADRLSSLTFQ